MLCETTEYFDNPKTFKNELTVNEIDKITKNLGPNLTNVNLTGGEPFARKEILDIARCYFKNTNIDSITMPSMTNLYEWKLASRNNISSQYIILLMVQYLILLPIIALVMDLFNGLYPNAPSPLKLLSLTMFLFGKKTLSKLNVRI